ncbi:uncharacterized protein Eint_050100 [Encephalitozoon intestinalis ATCC 50506]|uniref:Uncharacterized protein n=1 Tax=Encephalitozoon intestinalis (strain ATCC 50506) TaxID=876142 RepID=E0S731_ENCIT|nr:uncharacterized protein Eint_050100 [Encephalitozoon intestinalis ATCC 50506]ADM11459.1 hypothetical protein Eint_050100 [Encephalitozoon intestinalis ATCC 50506]UTX45169.1 hypothetical protein GPK93_05g07130 [Encephalitozoon intestinalis]
MKPFLIILSLINITSTETKSRAHSLRHKRYNNNHLSQNHLHRNHDFSHSTHNKPLSGIGISGIRRISPVYLPGYTSPLVADVGGDSGESGVILAPSASNGSIKENVGIYVSPSPNGQDTNTKERLVSLHHLIHHAQGEALKAKAMSSAAKLEASQLIALKQELNAKIMANKAEMLREEEERLVSQRSADPLVLVKDTVPIANVANNNLSFEHHNELLSQKLNMIKKDQDDAVKKAEKLARLHKARTEILPDSLVSSDPDQFKEFVAAGPVQDLTFEIPVDPSVGNYYISGNPEGSLSSEGMNLTQGDLPYFVAHQEGSAYSSS